MFDAVAFSFAVPKRSVTEILFSSLWYIFNSFAKALLLKNNPKIMINMAFVIL